jgi:HSP20 family protein
MVFNNSLMPWKWGKRNVPVRRDDSLPEYSNVFSLQHDMNRLFEDFFRPFDGSSFSPFSETSCMFQPRVDVIENEKDLRVSAELPGLDEKDLDVSILNDSLTIKGEKREEKEENAGGYHRIERHYGSFYRNIPLPCEVDKENAEAVFKRGVLTIILPKSKETRREIKKIEIKKE